MSKTLRILAKDIRHLKLEILLSLALTAGFAATEHFGWPSFGSQPFREAESLRTFMSFLMPLGWGLILTRNVHDESLVGDRQFWITRPYGWRRVLAAKVIFIALFICLPFFLAQCFLLHQAGLHPTAVLSGLLFFQLTLVAWLLLPLFAVSTVTPTLTRVLLLFLALGVYVALVAYLNDIFHAPTPWVPGEAVREIHLKAFFAWFMPIMCAAVVVLQYARRRTMISGALLAGLILLITICVSWPERYPSEPTQFPRLSAGETSPLNVALDAEPNLEGQPVPDDGGKFQSISLPLTFSGVAPGHVIQIVGKNVVFEVDDTSTTEKDHDGQFNPIVADEWTAGSENPFFGIGHDTDHLLLPRELYQSAVAKRLTVHLFYAVAELESGPSTPIVAHGDSFDVPDHGRCSIESNDGSIKDDSLLCYYALKTPGPTRIAWKLQQRCGVSSPLDMKDEEWLDNFHFESGFSLFGPVKPILTAFASTPNEKKVARYSPGVRIRPSPSPPIMWRATVSWSSRFLPSIRASTSPAPALRARSL